MLFCDNMITAASMIEAIVGRKLLFQPVAVLGFQKKPLFAVKFETLD